MYICIGREAAYFDAQDGIIKSGRTFKYVESVVHDDGVYLRDIETRIARYNK